MRVARLKAESYSKGVSIADDQVAAYYEANKARLEQAAARVKAEYVILSREGLTDQVSVDPEKVRQWYDGHQGTIAARRSAPRGTSLIQLAADASEEDVAAAKAKAEAILARLREDGSKNFGEIAKAESQDPGSADNGGDLGSFPAA